MTNALIVGDVHIADRAPSSRRDTYTSEILAKLEWCVAYANSLGVPVVFAGDLFHIKTPWRSSYALVQRVHDILVKAEGGVWILPGNHDLREDRLDSLPGQPLGALCRMGNVNLLIGNDERLPGVVGVPYLSAFDGGDWRKAIQDWMATVTPEPGWSNEDLIVTHAPIFPAGAEPGVYASIKAAEWAEFWGDGATYYGHIHESHGIYEVKVPQGIPDIHHMFCNHGALSRGSLHESSINRKPAVTLWEDGVFKPHYLPMGSVVKPAEEVFLFAEAAAKGEAKSSADAFTEALGEVVLSNLTVEEVIAQIKESNPAPNVMQVVEQVLEEAGA